MPNGYSWTEIRGERTYRLPGPEHLGWWAAVAMLFSILLHIAVFIMLDRMKIALRFEQARELNTRALNIQQVEVRPMEPERATPEETITPPDDASSLLEEIDLLAALPPDQEIDIRPDIDQAEYALQMQAPLLEGDPRAIATEITRNLEIDADLPDFGREPEELQPAAIGQITIDPGTIDIDDDLGRMTEEILKRGAGGDAPHGALDGIASLDDLLGLPPNELLGSKTMLPSDLLFEFNRAELRESAKVGLMKLALLMDRNPNLFCWIEGHTDLLGGDEFNLDLSLRRAEAVKRYLIESMRMDDSRIFTRGYGRYQPIVITGDRAEQAINRRVEIRMRESPPTENPIRISPQRAPVVDDPPPQTAEAPPPRAVLIKPRRTSAFNPDDIPRAVPVSPEPQAPPRALPVEE